MISAVRFATKGFDLKSQDLQKLPDEVFVLHGGIASLISVT